MFFRVVWEKGNLRIEKVDKKWKIWPFLVLKIKETPVGDTVVLESLVLDAELIEAIERYGKHEIDSDKLIEEFLHHSYVRAARYTIIKRYDEETGEGEIILLLSS